jgi:hypothetical protein
MKLKIKGKIQGYYMHGELTEAEIDISPEELASQLDRWEMSKLITCHQYSGGKYGKETPPKEPKEYNEDVIFMCKKHTRVNCGECFEVLPKKLEVPNCHLKIEDEPKENLTDVRECICGQKWVNHNPNKCKPTSTLPEIAEECEHGYVKNCVIQVREGDGVLFRRIDGKNPVAFLDSYYIIPKEDYEPQPKKIEECGCNPKTTNPMRYNPCSVCGKPLPKFNKIEELDMCIKKAINFDEIVVLKNMQDKINELVRVLNGKG